MRTEAEFLVDVLHQLNQIGGDYMLTGSMASNFWGIPRTTHDLDFIILLKPDQVDQFVAGFQQGFFIQPQSVRSVFQPPHQFNVLDEQSALKADFWQLRETKFEQEMFRRRLVVELFGTPASIATAEDVLRDLPPVLSPGQKKQLTRFRPPALCTRILTPQEREIAVIPGLLQLPEEANHLCIPRNHRKFELAPMAS